MVLTSAMVFVTPQDPQEASVGLNLVDFWSIPPNSSDNRDHLEGTGSITALDTFGAIATCAFEKQYPL